MITSGLFTYLFGIAKSYGIHYMWYFTLIQVRESFYGYLLNSEQGVLGGTHKAYFMAGGAFP
jgi:hypothetical protein